MHERLQLGRQVREFLFLGELREVKAPALGNGVNATPLRHGFLRGALPAHLLNGARDRSGAAKLMDKGTDHGGEQVTSYSGNGQQPFWSAFPEQMDDDCSMPDKPSEFNKAAGARLKLCREFLKLSRLEFAQILGRSRNVLENWESGDNCPAPEAIEKLRQRFHITHDWVYGGDPYLLPDDMGEFVTQPRQVGQHAEPKRRRA